MGLGVRVGVGGRGRRRKSEGRSVLLRIATSLLTLETEDSKTFNPAANEKKD